MQFDFESEGSYPDASALLDPPFTFDWHYVASTYLNGLVNFVQHQSAILFRGYYTDLEWPELERRWQQIGAKGHTSLRKYPGNIALIGHSAAHHWMFLFDHDVSDCRISRIGRKGYEAVHRPDGSVEIQKREYDAERLASEHGWNTALMGWATEEEWCSHWAEKFEDYDTRTHDWDGASGWIRF